MCQCQCPTRPLLHRVRGGGTSRKDSGEGGKAGDNRGITLELVLLKIKIKLDLPASYKKSRVLKKVVTKTNEKFKDYFTTSPPVLPFTIGSNEKAATQHRTTGNNRLTRSSFLLELESVEFVKLRIILFAVQMEISDGSNPGTCSNVVHNL